MRKTTLAATVFFSLLLASGAALADTRVALVQLASLSITPPEASAVAAPQPAPDEDAKEKARLAREAAALKAKHDADAAKLREQARLAAIERKKKQDAARIASLPAQGAGLNAQPAREAKAAPRMDRAALWAKCDATLSRGNRDDDIQRPGRVEACVRDGGPR